MSPKVMLMRVLRQQTCHGMSLLRCVHSLSKQHCGMSLLQRVHPLVSGIASQRGGADPVGGADRLPPLAAARTRAQKQASSGSRVALRGRLEGAVTYFPAFAVSSARRGLTSLFGMGRGGAPGLLPP